MVENIQSQLKLLKISEKVFYRIAQRWWRELNDEMNILSLSKNQVNFNFPTQAEVQAEMAAQEIIEGEELIRVYGIKMRQQTDFTSNLVKDLIQKVPGEGEFKELLKVQVDKNRELTAELEKVENDLEEKTELCEDLSLKCEQLTKRNSRLIGQIGSRSSGVEAKSESDAKDEPSEKVSRSDSELEIELEQLKTKNAELQVIPNLKTNNKLTYRPKLTDFKCWSQCQMSQQSCQVQECSIKFSVASGLVIYI